MERGSRDNEQQRTRQCWLRWKTILAHEIGRKLSFKHNKWYQSRSFETGTRGVGRAGDVGVLKEMISRVPHWHCSQLGPRD
ncbi:hypothetical protein YC2023_001277 [Brassica napus]